MNWTPPKQYQRVQRRATFHFLLKGRRTSALIELGDDLRAVLHDYEQANRGCADFYPFVFEMRVQGLRSARILCTAVLELIREEVVSQHYPYTLAWYAQHPSHYPAGILLTFALRPCDLREFVSA